MDRNLPDRPKKPVGAPKKIITREDIIRAMKMTSSNRAAARYLNVCYKHFQSYAKTYIDKETGQTFWDLHRNRGGRGVPKLFKNSKKNRIDYAIQELLDGKLIPPESFDIDKIKDRLMVEGRLKRECYLCGYKEARVLDGRIPLILHFSDGNKQNWFLDNLIMLCYNCYFLNVGKVFSEKDIENFESPLPVSKLSKESKLDLDPYHYKRLKELGVLPDEYINDDNIYKDLVPPTYKGIRDET